MDQTLPVTTVANIIELAIAPVFLLAGIGGILNVLAHRLARVVDRARAVEAEYDGLEAEARGRAVREMAILDRRMAVVNHAISACTASALFVCLVVAILFIADFADIRFGRPIAVIFVVAMALLIVGLILFLYEIRLAMRSLRERRKLHLRMDVRE
ncbi:MAG: DUF2721 domain-containing protein [Allosphingosinicella sp.]